MYLSPVVLLATADPDLGPGSRLLAGRDQGDASRADQARRQPAHAAALPQHPTGPRHTAKPDPAELSHPVFGVRAMPYCPADHQSLPAARPGPRRPGRQHKAAGPLIGQAITAG